MTRTALLRAAVAPLLATALGVAALGPAVSVAAASPLVPVLAAPSDDDATDPDRPVRIDVGRFEPRKGLLELLKAYRILRKTGCECRLLVVGAGPLGKEARRYVATRRLRGVEFLGRVSDEEKAQLFRTADVYVSPATGGESFGIVLLEAMAAGTAIVASDIHGYKGVLRRGREGLLVPPNEPKAIAAAIARLLRDDELRAAMGAAGRERAQEFSWERVTAKVDDYYGFVIRRLAARGELPAGFHAEVPASLRATSGPAVAAQPVPLED